MQAILKCNGSYLNVGDGVLTAHVPEDTRVMTFSLSRRDGGEAGLLLGPQLWQDRFTGDTRKASYVPYTNVESSQYRYKDDRFARTFTQSELNSISNATLANPYQVSSDLDLFRLVMDEQYFPAKFTFQYRRAWRVVNGEYWATIAAIDASSTYHMIIQANLICDGEWHTFEYDFTQEQLTHV